MVGGYTRLAMIRACIRLRPDRQRAVLWGALVILAGCEPERPPAPEPASVDADARVRDDEASSEPSYLDPKVDPFVLTFAGDRGAFADTSKVDDVPEASRGLVRVTLIGGREPPAGQVWVTNLRTPEPDGRYALSTVPRDMFEELALGQGLSSRVQLPEGVEPPTEVAAASGEVIVYKTAWCGVCKKVESYLKNKGVQYVAKDIEKDRTAAAELTAKAKQKGIATGSVPVIDVGGELIVGFDRARLEKLLAG